MKNFLVTLLIIAVITLIGYSLIGTKGNISELKRRVPLEVEQRNWKILRYEGFQYGSWNHHGGSVTILYFSKEQINQMRNIKKISCIYNK